MFKIAVLISSLFIQFSAFNQSMTFAYQKYESDEGLLSSEVFSVLKDSRGYMWFGSDNGIAKFDGYAFEYFTMSDGLTHNSVFHLYEDFAGRIWYSSFNGGIGYIENNVIKPYPYNNLLIERFSSLGWVDQIEVYENGSIRLNFSRERAGEIDINGNLNLFDESEQTLLFPLLGLSDQLNTKVISIKDSTFLVRGNLPNWCFPLGTKAKFLYNFPLSSTASIFHCNHTTVYVDSDTAYITPNGRSYSAFGIDNQGRIWSSHDRDGVEIYESVNAFFKQEPPLMHFFDGTKISQIIDDENGGMWITSINRGIYHIYNYQLENYEFEVRAKTQVKALCKDKVGGLYYACDEGEIVYIDSIGKHQVFLKKSCEVTEMEQTTANQLTISGFWHHRRGQGPELDEINGIDLTYFEARGFLALNDSVTWLISGSNAQQFINESLVYTTPGNNFYRDIIADQNGRVWLGGSHGLAYWDENKFVDVSALINDLDSKYIIKDIKSYHDNLLIISANHGAYFLVKKDTSYQRYRIPMSDCILETGELDLVDSVLWLSSNKGVSKIKFNADCSYEINQITYWRGLASNEVNDIELLGDYVYAATNKGLSKFHKDGLAMNKTPIKLYINSFFVNGKEWITNKNPTLNYQENNVQFSYNGLSFRTSENTNYKYKLEGLDEQWQYTQNREVSYQNLPPGSYHFLVAASNENGIWSENKAISFNINKPIWQRGLFIVIAVFLVFLVIVILYRWRIKRGLSIIQNEREKERNKRKVIEAKLVALRSQMNPHFTFNALNAIQNVMINFSPKEATSYMTSFSILIRKILQSSEDLYISLEEELEMLQLYVELENLRFNNSIEFSIDIAETIDADFEEIPSMIIQPFVENAIIHGLSGKEGAKNIALSLQLVDEDIICLISDNGIGRVKANEEKRSAGINHESLGIKITEERLKLFSNRGGNEVSYKITDCYDKDGKATGTKVEILFKKNRKTNE